MLYVKYLKHVCWYSRRAGSLAFCSVATTMNIHLRNRTRVLTLLFRLQNGQMVNGIGNFFGFYTV